MKYSLFILLFILMVSFSCQQGNSTSRSMQSKIDSLEGELAHAYKPGLGEFMSGIQVHHAKLWFAGKNNNWSLADFEIKEIKEALDDIHQYCTDRPETKFIEMMDAPIDTLTNAISHQNITQFNNGYTLLTSSCNTCHKETNHAFNVITIPSTPPFDNQDFKAR